MHICISGISNRDVIVLSLVYCSITNCYLCNTNKFLFKNGWRPHGWNAICFYRKCPISNHQISQSPYASFVHEQLAVKRVSLHVPNFRFPWWPLHMPTATRHEGFFLLDGIKMLSRVIWFLAQSSWFQKNVVSSHMMISWWTFRSFFSQLRYFYSRHVQFIRKVDLTWWEPLSLFLQLTE